MGEDGARKMESGPSHVRCPSLIASCALPAVRAPAGCAVFTRRAVLTRNAGPLLDHADRVADERFTAGFDLFEVQIAFNALEEAIWREVLDHLPSDEQPGALGLISTALGIGKDALARGFPARANQHQAPSVDLRALFQGL